MAENLRVARWNASLRLVVPRAGYKYPMRQFINIIENAGDDVTLYHVTPTANMASIRSAGLVPLMGDRSSKMEDDPAIFLFKSKDDADDAVSNWLGDEFDEDEGLTLLQITVPRSFIIPSSAEYEVMVKDVITPDRIIDLGEI